MPMNTENYSSRQFAIFRMAFGTYMLFWAVQTWYFSASLYGPAGFFSELNSDFNDTGRNLLFLTLSMAAIAFSAGFQRRWTSLVLALGWTFLSSRTSFVTVPSHGYVGWLLFICTLVPDGEDWSFTKRKSKWNMPPLIIESAWLVIGLSYTASGIDKLLAPSWLNGDAMRFVSTSPIMNAGWFADLLREGPLWISQFMTWAALAAEVLYAPLCMYKRTRLMAWLLMIALHVQALFFFDILPVSTVMLIVHGFVFDRNWLSSITNFTFSSIFNSESKRWGADSFAVSIIAISSINLFWFLAKDQDSQVALKNPIVKPTIERGENSGQRVFCTKRAAHGSLSFEGKVILNSNFIVHANQPSESEIKEAVAKQISFAGQNSSHIIYSRGLNILSTQESSQKIQILSVKKTSYQQKLSIEWPSGMKTAPEGYLKRAVDRGYTKVTDPAWEVLYRVHQEASACLNSSPSDLKLEWRLPIDPYLALWLIHRDQFRGGELFPCAANIGLASGPRTLAEVWNPRQIGYDKNQNYFECESILNLQSQLSHGRVTLDLKEQSSYLDVLPDAGLLLENESEIRADIVLGRTSTEAELNPSLKKIEELLYSFAGKQKHQLLIDSKLNDRSSRLLLGSAKDLGYLAAVQGISIEKSNRNWEITFRGSLHQSGRPIQVRFFWGEDPNFFLSQALKSAHLISYFPGSTVDYGTVLPLIARALANHESKLPYQAIAFADSHSFSKSSVDELTANLSGPTVRDLITSGSVLVSPLAFSLGLIGHLDQSLNLQNGQFPAARIQRALAEGQLMISTRLKNQKHKESH
jgi:hypothetical protein